MKQKLILFVSFLFLGIGGAFSQIKVTGIVVDEQDEPVIGATIQVKGKLLILCSLFIGFIVMLL